MSPLYAAPTFEDFWPHYVRLHTKPVTHVLHAAGSLACLACLVLAVALRAPYLVLLGPAADYALAQASHRLVEANRTTPWRNPLWHTRAEMRMLRLVLSGRMRAEVARIVAA
jgi:hypothetical protein